VSMGVSRRSRTTHTRQNPLKLPREIIRERRSANHDEVHELQLLLDMVMWQHGGRAPHAP
jgi:hypothetical protein